MKNITPEIFKTPKGDIAVYKWYEQGKFKLKYVKLYKELEK
jgi:hypothetical protein